VDLAAEDVRDAHGQRITEARAAELADDALAKVLGRPSLTAPGTRSPETRRRWPTMGRAARRWPSLRWT
jgi:hypothetical protein